MSILVRTLMLSAAVMAHPAWAADPAISSFGDETDQQTTSAGTGAGDDTEILVTARRRQETAQEVPLPISVVGGEHIDNTGAFNVG
ncbi:MAG: TonB-dependent receptor, partial [Novosphingobium sp.]